MREVDELCKALEQGPKSSRELGVSPEVLRGYAGMGVVRLDPDAFPDEYVPFNPLVVRLPHDERPWPGWKAWNV